MADIDLKTETPDTTLPSTGFLFGADSQAAASPSVYTLASVISSILGNAASADALVFNNDARITRRGAANLRLGAADAAGSSITVASVDTSAETVTLSSAHGLTSGGAVQFTTTGALPGGITAGTTYYVRVINTTTFELYDTYANAVASSGTTGRINITSAGTGTHTCNFALPFQQLSVQSFTGTNIPGQPFVITGSQGTGTGRGGDIIFQVAPAGSSGTAQNAFQTVLQITGEGGLTGQDGATANTLALRNGTNAQGFKIYNTTDGTNSSFASFFFFSNDFYVLNDKTGTGASGRIIIRSLGALRLGANSSAAWEFTTSNHLTCLTDNTHDIGASGANRPRSIFVGTSIRTPQINNNAGTIGIEGTTSSFPALKRSSTTLQVRLADDTANAPLESASVKTDAPAGGTSGTWKLGIAATVSPTSPNRTIEVDIGGTIYYIAAKTTND